MLETIKAYGLRPYHAAKGLFGPNKPHFNFIWAHYAWIIGGTIIASILIYAAGTGDLNYIDALLFASGANTQAGLNPIDVNKLNTAQQIIMYFFPMLSNPITLHGSVVLLRLYWFEKRFQHVVKDARQKRMSVTKTRSIARNDDRHAEEGVNGRNITVVPHEEGKTPPRITNDGIVLGDDPNAAKRNGGSEGSDTTTAEQQPDPDECAVADSDGEDSPPGQVQGTPRPPGHTRISFAHTVKRSDGVDDDPTNFIQHRTNTEHIRFLESQRQDNETLRIPGPRDIERGLGPRRINAGEHDDDNNTLALSKTRDTHPDNATIGSHNIPRQPTIQFEEPDRPKDEDASDSFQAAKGTLQALRLRKPRAWNDRQSKVHEDNNEGDNARHRTFDRVRTALTRDKYDDMPYLSYTPTTARNSNFVGLTLEQREELGGIEYRSLRTLMWVLLGYFWGFQLLGLVAFLPYILHNSTYRQVVQEDAISPTWWGFWTANVAFMDVGFTLTPDSMISFQESRYVLMWMTFLIIIGNTGFPVMLRFIIWVVSKLVPKGSGLWEELRFLLDHPRRCFTLLFPAGPNWWLFWILVALNLVDLIFFIILDLNAQVVENLPVHIRVVNGLFVAASTRTAGFSSLPLADLHPAMPVLYMIMMYISVFPIAISIRRTNVYEEKSLGVYSDKKEDDEEAGSDENAVSYVSMHLRRQLSFDLWYVFLGFFLLAITEGGKLKRQEFSMFDVLFEIVSAYGTVGLSMGVMNVDASLCSQFSTLGKLLIIAMEIRGRHRGLPYGLDRAVILPSESRFRNENEERQPTFPRSNTGTSAVASGVQRRDSSVQRGRSLSRERDRILPAVARLMHPGPAIPPAMRPGHSRTRSNASDLSRAVTNGSRRPQSYHTAVAEDEGEAMDGLAPLRTIESGPPKRRDDSPMTRPRRSFTG